MSEEINAAYILSAIQEAEQRDLPVIEHWLANSVMPAFLRHRTQNVSLEMRGDINHIKHTTIRSVLKSRGINIAFETHRNEIYACINIDTSQGK